MVARREGAARWFVSSAAVTDRPPTRSARARRAAAAPERRGAALLLAFLVLIVMIAIMYQIQSVTQIDSRVSRQEIARSRMDTAITSTFLQIYEDLKEDKLAAMGGDEGGAGGQAPTTAEGPGAAAGEGGEPGEPPRNPETVDSKLDAWYTPQSTNFDDIQIRIVVRDEESKYNVLNMLADDEEAAAEAFQTVVRILDNAREGTDLDISSSEAEEMAGAMREYMIDRRSADEIGRPQLLTSDESAPDRVLPMTFREFGSLEPFDDIHFRDLFGEDEERIHGLGSFLTIYTSPSMGAETAGEGPPIGVGGDKVNVNTAPLAVLAALFDDREIDYRVWDEILEYRNEEEEPLESEEDGLGSEEPEPLLDEFGREIAPTKIFDSLDELDEVNAFKDLDAAEQAKIREKLTVNSEVFEIILAARISTAADSQERSEFESRREQEEYFRSGVHLVRVVRSVVWRRENGDEVDVAPLVPFEILEDPPLQVLDFPDDE